MFVHFSFCGRFYSSFFDIKKVRNVFNIYFILVIVRNTKVYSFLKIFYSMSSTYIHVTSFHTLREAFHFKSIVRIFALIPLTILWCSRVPGNGKDALRTQTSWITMSLCSPGTREKYSTLLGVIVNFYCPIFLFESLIATCNILKRICDLFVLPKKGLLYCCIGKNTYYSLHIAKYWLLRNKSNKLCKFSAASLAVYLFFLLQRIFFYEGK